MRRVTLLCGLLAGLAAPQPSHDWTDLGCSVDASLQCVQPAWRAQEGATVDDYWDIAPPDGGTPIRHAELEDTVSLAGKPVTVFRMLHGGCLRGPAAFFDEDGKATLTIPAGSVIGEGCDK